MKLRAAIILISAFAAAAFGQTPDYGRIVENYKTDKQFSGAVLVATDGKIDYLGAVGLADRERRAPVKTDSKFRIASVTKTFTAVLIMKLYEQGRLDLDAALGRYFPEYRGAGRDKVTIRQLLTYSSGIADEAGKEGLKSYQTPLTLDAYIDKYCSGKLEFAPGSKSAYGNTEYIILGKIVEKITGRSFAKVLDAEILRPLKMKNSGLADSRKKVAGMVESYTRSADGKEFRPDEPYLIENYFAAGAMYSTVVDLLKFDAAIFGAKLLKPETTALMLKFYPELGYVAHGFWGSDGYGSFAEKFYYRPGGIRGSNANWIRTLGTKKTVIVLGNSDAANLFELSEKLYLAAVGR